MADICSKCTKEKSFSELIENNGICRECYEELSFQKDWKSDKSNKFPLHNHRINTPVSKRVISSFTRLLSITFIVAPLFLYEAFYVPFKTHPFNNPADEFGFLMAYLLVVSIPGLFIFALSFVIIRRITISLILLETITYVLLSLIIIGLLS